MFGINFEWWKKPKEKEDFEKKTSKNNNSLKYESIESDSGKASVHQIDADEKYRIMKMPMTGTEFKLAGLREDLKDKRRDKSDAEKTMDISGGFEGLDSRIMLEQRAEKNKKEITEIEKKISDIIQQN